MMVGITVRLVRVRYAPVTSSISQNTVGSISPVMLVMMMGPFTS